jgi:CRISPR-associated protein Cas1
MQDLHELPKLSDSISYLYVEHCILEQKAQAVEKIDKEGRTMIPAANLTVLMLGPGTSISHAAVKSLAQNGCGIVWVGEDATRFYAHGNGETRRAYHLLHQARLASDPQLRLEVCKRMYRKRFDEELAPGLTIEQLRGMEGARVRTVYTRHSILHNIPWEGRNYDRNNWGAADPINRALSTANTLLYGICHAAIVSGGYSPALGFIHIGKQRSFVFDIADLYKVEITIPLAFRVVRRSNTNLYAEVRKACREAFKEHRLLQRILPDIGEILDLSDETLQAGAAADVDAARPEPLWTPSGEVVAPIENPRSDEIPTDETFALNLRLERALQGIENGWQIYTSAPGTWQVITTSGPPGYTIRLEGGKLACTCPDYAKNELSACKHTLAVQILQERGRL